MNTTERIESVHDQIKDALATCATSRKKSELVRCLSSVSQLVGETVAWLKADQKGKFIPVRKALVSVSNVCDGLVNGLEAGEISLPDFRASINVLSSKFVTRVESSLAAEAAALEALAPQVVLTPKQQKIKISLSNTPEAKKAVAVINKSLRERESIEKGSAEITLDAMSKARDNLPIKIDGEFSTVRMPVVPIFSNQVLNSEATFKKLGLRYFPIEGYGILLDQLLLVVSTATAKKHGVETLAFAQSVVEMLNERGSVEYSLVSDNPCANPRNTGLMLFWIMPINRMNALMKIVNSGRTPTTMKWGLPF